MVWNGTVWVYFLGMTKESIVLFNLPLDLEIEDLPSSPKPRWGDINQN